MASGPQHFVQANQVLNALASLVATASAAEVRVDSAEREFLLRLAQVHATLAGAAAAVDSSGLVERDGSAARAWSVATAPARNDDD